jgi:hypothetical protein
MVGVLVSTDCRECRGNEETRMAQITPPITYHHDLARRVVNFLQTEDPRIFPFTLNMDETRLQAFKRDLREGLGEVYDSGSARKTSATGHLVNNRRLIEIVEEWRAAGGGWPTGADPDALDTALAALEDIDDEDDIELAEAAAPDDVSDFDASRSVASRY